MAELVPIIQGLPDGDERRRLEDAYWALAIEQYGPVTAARYHKEYEWLRARQ